ncbi:MerR family transcriptional regulator [Desulfitobacterium sp. LBE]|uniref:MerR family transcriptional regulator n=1 Tax=Desulfitobacterium sp. LBE TaxID=884086 RepID=UPI00119BEF0E|nr:MerR family transcriptional regulator [Desulfitobacterium sp. LBE]TWH57182.1 MerR family transcriptional regulator [Desulfitobacterium sp. LBE]
MMLYTVKEVAGLAGVTVKTLHHYHKIGLLKPCEITDAGYRLYGAEELERLQQILFYRELDFSLSDIQKALEDQPGRLMCLTKQQELLIARRQRLDCLLKTIGESIVLTKKGEVMEKSAMFQGLNADAWNTALAEQSQYLKDHYGYELPKVETEQTDEMNDSAAEAKQFLDFLAEALRAGWKGNDPRLHKKIEEHLAFLKDHGHLIDAQTFAAQARFFLEDDFHRGMLESQQLGLCYYLCIAAEMYAAANQ